MQRQVHLDHVLTNHALERIAQLDRDALELVAVTRRIFPALARIALSADAVHGDSQRGMGLGRNRAQRHGAGGKTLDDFLGRFDLIDGDGLGRIELELKQSAQRQVALGLVVDELGVFLVRVPVVGARAVLQLGNRIGRPHMLLTAHTPGVFATGFQRVGQHRAVAKGGVVHTDGFFGDVEHANALDAAGCAGEVLGHGGSGQANRLEQLGAAVAHIGADTHLGHDLG